MTMPEQLVHLEPMAPTGPGNPFSYDLSNMGTQMGKDHYLMFPNHKDEELKWFILVDTRTGNRVRIVVH